jgi:amidase
VRQELERALAKDELDVILGPGDGRISSIAAVAGYAVGVMPLGYANFNGRALMAEPLE